jgi:hypothetical protein
MFAGFRDGQGLATTLGAFFVLTPQASLYVLTHTAFRPERRGRHCLARAANLEIQ